MALVWIIAFITATILATPSVAAGEGCTLVTQRVQCRSLTCNVTSGDCMLCTTNAQCYQEAYGCNANGHCVLMPLSNTFTLRTLLAPVAGFVVCAIAVLAGVGGGAILSPLFNVILEIPFADAVALAQCAICGQSLLNVAMQMMKTHKDHSAPNPTRPNINYEYACLLLPIAMSGTFLGSVGNKVSPNWLRVVLLIVLFSNALFRLIKRMVAEKRAADVLASAEARELDLAVAVSSGAIDIEQVRPRGREDTSTSSSSPSASAAAVSLEVSPTHDHGNDRLNVAPSQGPIAPAKQSVEVVDDTGVAVSARVRSATMWRRHPYWCLWAIVTVALAAFLMPSYLQALVLAASFAMAVALYVDYIRMCWEEGAVVEESPQAPTTWIVFCGLIVAVFTTISYLTRHAIDCGSTTYYMMLVVVPMIGVAMTCGVRWHLAELHEKVLRNELPAAVVPFEWNTKTTVIFPLVCIVAGFAATMLGIGGGLVLSSLLLEVGMAPGHASATSGLTTLLIAAQSVITLIIGDKLRMDYGLLCFVAGMLSTVFGRLVLMRQIEKRGASYLIVAALAFIMGGSMVAIVTYGIWNTYNIFAHDGSLGFGPLCATDASLTTTVKS